MAESAPSALLPLEDLLTRHAAGQPGATALRFEGESLSYGQIQAQALASASVLAHRWGVRPGDRVAWLGGNHPGQLVLLFALAHLGAILLPLNFRLAPVEWDALVAGCGPRHLVHDAQHAVEHATGSLAGVLGWLTNAGLSAVVGVILGTIIALVLHKVLKVGAH